MGTVMTQQESNEMGIRLIHGYGKEWEFTSWKLEQWKCKKINSRSSLRHKKCWRRRQNLAPNDMEITSVTHIKQHEIHIRRVTEK